MISAFGVANHQLWLIWLGSGVIGGIGLGLGYISPVSTLIKWFPDRRGMATGLAIMGFGGGAMIGSPLADKLMKHFASATSVGVTQTFLVLAAVYFVFMMGGALGYRLPPENWKPAGWNPDTAKKALVTKGQVHLNVAWRTPQFWLVWLVLMLNVSAGIGILSMASPILQEVFGGPPDRRERLVRSAHSRTAGEHRGPRRRLHRAVVAVQYRRPHLLGLALGQDRPQGDLRRLLPPGDRALFLDSLDGRHRQPGALRAVLLHHSVDVRRRLRHGAGVPVGSVRHPAWSARSMAGC